MDFVPLEAPITGIGMPLFTLAWHLAHDMLDFVEAKRLNIIEPEHSEIMKVIKVIAIVAAAAGALVATSCSGSGAAAPTPPPYVAPAK